MNVVRMLKVQILLLMIGTLLISCNPFQKQQSPEPAAEKQPRNGQKEESVRVLVIGSDNRDGERANSDSIMVVDYVPEEASVKVISIMRDSFVKIPDYEKGYNKINAAYYLGGNDLLKSTISANFGIDVDYTAVIDFKGFISLIDYLAPDGMKVHVTPEMIDDMNMNIQPGIQPLEGEQLLKYVRFRHDSESDFGRVQRQQEVLLMMKDHVSSRLQSIDGIAAMPELLGEALKYVETDMPMGTMLQLLGKLALNTGIEVKSLRIPVQNTFIDETYEHSGAVLEMNIPANKEAILEFLEAVPVQVPGT
ncbi:LytR family transcriptional regulator [Bacillus lacus]|uniref:Regulatory protein MsrR n=1 Tax=Metabacillus lacus TaxID=1983721 RepID=A0A7X2IY28_9BACI|nr:LCP family protein [Metabacillus lacus]MRX71910.1 LytR family transcriptional regulator [Metabacillus lacus]